MRWEDGSTYKVEEDGSEVGRMEVEQVHGPGWMEVGWGREWL